MGEHPFAWYNTRFKGAKSQHEYLPPIVDELIEGWSGVLVVDDGSIFKKLYRFALCLASDIPETRKCGGFLSFSANKGKFDFRNLV